ncbi:MAG: NYN domain-containing protein [Candidatus Helarchaeota archaeon]
MNSVEQKNISSFNFAIIDASNISFINNVSRSKEQNPQIPSKKLGYFHNVEIVYRSLLNFNPNLKIILIGDASLKYKVIDIDTLLEYEKDGKLYFAPARTKADFFILKYAQLHPDAIIISNDQFKEFDGSFEEVKRRRIPLMIIEDEVIFYEYF